MLKVIVIGSPGAGKSMFSRKLRDVTGLPLYYLDMLWHKPEQTNISEEEFDARLNEIVKKEQWIMDFSKDQLPQIYELLEKYQEGRDIVIFKSRREAEEWLGRIVKGKL